MQIQTIQKRSEGFASSQNADEALSSNRFTQPTFLMRPPSRYQLDQRINPWMTDSLYCETRDIAFNQWNGLYQALKTLGDVRLIHAHGGSSDMSFVAHGAVVNYGVAALSCPANSERAGEEDDLQDWLEEAGFIVWKSEGLPLEGESDVLFSHNGQCIWAAYGSRTSLRSHGRLSNVWHVDVVSLQLIDPRFHRLDLCFAPLSDGHVLYYPGAFDRRSLAKIEDSYSRHQRIVVMEEEAIQLSCNVINIGYDVLMHAAIRGVANRLRNAGYRVSEFPLGEFVRCGGAAKSMALRLSDLCVTHRKL